MKIDDFYYIKWRCNDELMAGYLKKDNIVAVYQNPDGRAILDLANGGGILIEESYQNVMIDLFSNETKPIVFMTEARYQFLNSLSIEQYNKETTADEQQAFCAYQRKYHPEDVMFYQTHNP